VTPGSSITSLHDPTFETGLSHIGGKKRRYIKLIILMNGANQATRIDPEIWKGQYTLAIFMRGTLLITSELRRTWRYRKKIRKMSSRHY
jgi:hypothetical protein